MNAVILIVDDEKNTREGLGQALRSRERRILLADDVPSAEEILKSEPVDLVLADLKLPGMDGLELLRRVQGMSLAPLFIVMTAYGTVETAVRAMKQGAYDYLTKPVNLDQLELLVARALKGKNLEAENVYLREQLTKNFGLEALTGKSAAMEKVFELIRQIAPSRSTALITGESGTGKELVARAIHLGSPRRSAPFIPVHCASLASTLLESELFGHEKGAFTGAGAMKKGRFELADAGTIFLDEVSEIPPETQVKLLRALETHEFERVGGTRPIRVDIRLIAATNADLSRLAAQGKFREDLFYRLNVVRIDLPPLRERKEDIPLLVRRFLDKFGRENGREGIAIAPPAIRLLLAHDWPGNVRELKNCVESMVVLARGLKLTVADLPPALRELSPAPSVSPAPWNLKDAGKDLMEKALHKAGGNKAAAARLLGISRRTLYRKIGESPGKGQGPKGQKGPQ
jgi:DNA-binding NtrC family response regulator